MLNNISIKTKIYAIIIIVLALIAIAVNYKHFQAKPIVLAANDAARNDYVQVFSKIYAENHWGLGSGVGSDPANAKQYIELLQQYFDDPKYKTIVDLGCGDWQIMRTVRIPADKTYIGLDVVPSIIETDSREFAKDNVKFYHVSNLQQLVEQNVTGDLLIVKDVLQHWPFAEIEYFMANILPRFKYALITNQYIVDDRLHNQDKHMGPVHSLGLLTAPFNLQHAKAIMEYDGPDHKQVIWYENPNLA